MSEPEFQLRDNSKDHTNSVHQNAYVLQEYLYNQLPIYFFIIAGLIRYKRIIDEEIKVTPEQHEKQKYTKAVVSFLVKRQLSRLISILYIFSVIFSLVVPKETGLYFGSNYKWGSLIYLLGSLIWYLSSKVLEIEYYRELSQALYCHRIFWPFSACFQIICIFQEYKGLLNIILNTCKALPEFLLMFYAIYKPYDDLQQYIENQQDIPTFARLFIEKFESNRLVFYVLNIRNTDEGNNDIELPLITDGGNQIANNNTNIDMAELSKYIPQQKFQQVEQERFLFNKLPRSAIAINQKIIVKYENENQQRFYYHIITQIGQNKYDCQINYQDILQLEGELELIYKGVNNKQFPKIKRIKMKNQESQEQYLSRRIGVLENWFKALFKEPIFVHKQLLDTLCIEQTAQYPYLTYFQLVCNTNPQYFSVNATHISPALKVGYSDNTSSVENSEVKNNLAGKKKRNRLEQAIEDQKSDMEFDISCDSFEKTYGIWEFVLNIHYYSKNYDTQPLIWRVKKSFQEIKEFNQNLEQELCSQIGVFQRSVIKVEKLKNDNESLLEKQKAIDKYIQTIVDNKFYWTKTLFQFIEFDVVNEKQGMPQGNSSRNSRGSFYNQQNQNNNNIMSRDNSGKQFDISIIQSAQSQNQKNNYNNNNEFNSDNEEQQQDNVLNQKFDTKTSTIYFPNKNKRIFQGIDFNKVAIKVSRIFTRPDFNYNYQKQTDSDQNRNIMIDLFFQEYLQSENQQQQTTNNNNNFKKLEIRVRKSYADFENLHLNIKSIYYGLGQHIPELPKNVGQQDVGGSGYTPRMFKNSIEEYFQKILNLKQIQENSFFLKFFGIQNRVFTSSFNNETQIFDYIEQNK